MKKIILFALVFALAGSLFACGDSGSNVNSGENNELSPEISEALKWKDNLDFFFTIDGAEYQITAYKTAMSWLRADKDELIQYLANPEYDTGLRDESYDQTDEIEYMIFDFPNPSIAIENEIYPASYKILKNGEDSLYYIDMMLVKINGEWKVKDITFQK